MERDQAVRARGVGKWFGEVVALDGVDLDVGAGAVHGLIGPNGAGKTTLLGLLLGLAVPDRGELTVLGVTVGRALGVPDGVAGFVDGPGLYPSLSPRRNLRALAALRGLRPGRRSAVEATIDEVLDEVGLAEVADDPVRGFSLGMRQRLGLASALLTRPRLLVLDEPANGLDPTGTRQVHRTLTRLAGQGTAVVLSSHRMDDLAALCSSVTLLATGRVVFTGPVADLAAAHGALDYRLRTTDPDAARTLAGAVRGLVLVDDPHRAPAPDTLVVRAADPALDALVRRLVEAGIAVRELAPVVAPLEAAYLALTGSSDDHRGADHVHDHQGRPGDDHHGHRDRSELLTGQPA
ncbi:ABC-2 type transport system ATP-binding protein [Friedmanniella endophytica]|uniref:ABC-2 type transport system ATP-binding protein n=1 Tax=Microlunatus kandeliicorticis TaxID=1759536 RepID=A0A7W3P6B3_9ACTN|nr:ABC transporter ATP-binding protein [Microlunatus kandeliicorticis]MBA8794772.1 ABC-2 type transport system ATP-binding protein [Microlunatus kandeliicorticis]